LLVSLNGVLQAPQDSFTVSGSQITFDSALTSSDSIDFIMALGDTLDIGVPSAGSVDTSQLANGAVTSAKITYPLTTFSSTGIDDNATSTAMTLDSSNNLLVGTASYDNGFAGHGLGANGFVYHTRDNALGMVLNRKTSDGDIVEFRKDTAAVGSIGVDGGDNFYITGQTGNTGGIYMNDAAVSPAYQGVERDNYYNLGKAPARWKDLYLSGGVYVGGTGSANYLDDYEEGTWTASYTGGATLSGGNNACRYTKIGNLVHCSGSVYYTSVSGGSGDLKLTGFPFTQSSGQTNYSTATIAVANWSSQAPEQANLVNTELSLFYGGGTSANSAIQVSSLGAYSEIYFTISYVTDA